MLIRVGGIGAAVSYRHSFTVESWDDYHNYKPNVVRSQTDVANTCSLTRPTECLPGTDNLFFNSPHLQERRGTIFLN